MGGLEQRYPSPLACPSSPEDLRKLPESSFFTPRRRGGDKLVSMASVSAPQSSAPVYGRAAGASQAAADMMMGLGLAGSRWPIDGSRG